MRAALYLAAVFCAGIGFAETGPTRLIAPVDPLPEPAMNALQKSISRCWNIGALSSEAARTKVVVLVAMNADSRPSGISLLGFEGGSEASAQQSFESARRAIIRCAAEGYPLPLKKYDQWREIILTFDPSEMRIR
jgi:hypothetical protein